MTSVGFTGTRTGMTLQQTDVILRQLIFWLCRPGDHEWHDGDCKGADDEAHNAVEGFKKQGYNVKLIGHPCSIEPLQVGNEFDERREVKQPLNRNKDIVNESDVMLAAPKETLERFIGSGTWATIRYATKMGRPTLIVFPNGTIESRNEYFMYE